MPEQTDDPLEPTPEQRRYARVLQRGMYLGLLCLFVTFALYVSGIVKPYIPLEQLPQYWSMSAPEYLEAGRIEAGWNWVPMLGYGDFLNFVGIAALAGVTVLCYLVILPLLWKRGDKVYAILALLEVIVLVVAASGIIAVGH